MMENELEKKRKEHRGSTTSGIILIGLGLIFLLSNLNLLPPIGDSWPLFLILIGGAMLFGASRERRKRAEQQAAENASHVPPTPTYPTSSES